MEALGPSALRQVARYAIPDIAIPAAATLKRAVVPGGASTLAAIRAMAARS
jgi:hypothetical protein